METNQEGKPSKKANILFAIFAIVSVVIIYRNVSSVNHEESKSASNSAIQKTESTPVAKVPTQEVAKKEPTATEETNPVKRIEAIVKKVDDELTVTVWDSKQNFAKETTPPPYEIMVNAGNGTIASCYYAKIVSHDVMEALYSDATVKNKISRVIFTSWGQLRVSVSAEDGVKTDWVAVGPTNFWTTMMKYKPYEDETGPINQRTWGKYISSDCN